MPYIQISSHTTGRILFGGDFMSLRSCVEAAVARNVDLSGADLSHTNLTNTNLDEAMLAGALFGGANLTGANISDALLDGACFRGASLFNTCLAQSRLRGCDFTDAAFGATDITGADVSGSIFSTASCFTLDFAFTEAMEGCLFRASDGLLCQMSRAPTVIRGPWGHPIAIMDHHVKVGPHVRTLPWRALPARAECAS